MSIQFDDCAKALGLLEHAAISDDLPTAVSVPVSWVSGRVEAVTHESGSGYILHPDRFNNSLPCEFWNHQLLKVDIKDDDSLADFISDWGIPYHPARNLHGMKPEERTKYGITETDKYADIYKPRPHAYEIDGVYHLVSKTSPVLSYISKKELEQSLITLKAMIGFLVYGQGASDRDSFAVELLNCATCNPFVLRRLEYARSVPFGTGADLLSRGLLTSAIANQLIESFSDDAEWRRCACEGCNRIFKRKQPKSKTIQPDRDSIYCCEKCKYRQTKRNQRAAAKSRIDHGI